MGEAGEYVEEGNVRVANVTSEPESEKPCRPYGYAKGKGRAFSDQNCREFALGSSATTGLTPPKRPK